MRASVISAAVAAVAMLLSYGADAQSPSAPLLSSPGPKACPPDVVNPPLASNPTYPLSEQLSESKGVICPPAGIDPGLTERPPPTRDNPVIPPPGSPGGNPNVIPK